MNDFDFDVMTKKRLAKNAYAKKGTRGGKTCRLPGDYLTPAQRKALNGPTKTFKLGEPMDWGTFRSMPDDLQREYLNKLIDRFHASDPLLGEMFGVKNVAVGRRRKELGITRTAKVYPTEAQRKAFRDWFNGVDSTPTEQDAPEHEATPEPEAIDTPDPAPAPTYSARLYSGSFTVSGTASEALAMLCAMFRDDRRNGSFTLSFTYEEDANG